MSKNYYLLCVLIVFSINMYGAANIKSAKDISKNSNINDITQKEINEVEEWLKSNKFKGVNSENTQGYPFHEAIIENKIEFLKILKFIGGNINVKSAVLSGYSPLLYATYKGNFRAVSQLLYLGADINAITHSGSSALIIAIKQICNPTNVLGGGIEVLPQKERFFDIFNLLINSGIDVDIIDNYDNDALHYAKNCDKNTPEIAKIIKTLEDIKERALKRKKEIKTELGKYLIDPLVNLTESYLPDIHKQLLEVEDIK